MNDKDLTHEIIGAAIEVHKALGPGLLESAYEVCLAAELSAHKIQYSRQVPLPLHYKGQHLDCGYRLDFVIQDRVILELKSIEKLLPIHKAQLLSYLKLSNKSIGLLINFNVTRLTDGIIRLVHNYEKL